MGRSKSLLFRNVDGHPRHHRSPHLPRFRSRRDYEEKIMSKRGRLACILRIKYDFLRGSGPRFFMSAKDGNAKRIKIQKNRLLNWIKNLTFRSKSIMKLFEIHSHSNFP